MSNLIIIAILALAIAAGIRETVKHFKGEGGCCGGGSTVKSRKKLDKVVRTRTVTIEGMTCENCANRVEWALSDTEGLVGKVSLKKKTATVYMDRDVTDETITAVIEKAGYKVVEIR